MSIFEWTAERERAAMLIAKDELTNEQIAEQCNIGVATLYRWKEFDEFQERIRKNLVKIREAILSQEIGEIYKRVLRLNKRWQQIDQLIPARAQSPEMQAVAGGETGLLVRTFKSIGSGEYAEKVEEYRFDAALVREERELAKQAAQECGQWMEKVDVTSLGQGIQESADLSPVSLEKLRQV